MNDLLKIKRVLTGYLQNLFIVLMALCDTEVKNQIKALPNFKDMDKNWILWPSSTICAFKR